MIRDASLPMDESILILFDRVCLPNQRGSSPSVRHALGEILLSLSHRLTEMNVAHTVGWMGAEGGDFVGHRIDSEESFQLILSEILSVSVYRGKEDTVEGYLKTGDDDRYANIVYIGTAPSESLAMLPLSRRKTMILCNVEKNRIPLKGIPSKEKRYCCCQQWKSKRKEIVYKGFYPKEEVMLLRYL